MINKKMASNFFIYNGEVSEQSPLYRTCLTKNLKKTAVKSQTCIYFVLK